MVEKIGKITLDYSHYPGEDFYCDGDIEQELLDIAQNFSASEFPRIIEEKKSWPVLYHLSELRENIVDWLPIKPGDKVLVWQDWLYVGNVTDVAFFKKTDAPYPVEKTWLIQKKVFDRIDFMKYNDSSLIITGTNLYKDNYLNSENDHKQYLAKVDYQYQWLAEEQNEYFDKRKNYSNHLNVSADDIISSSEYDLDWEWCESNQLDVFYRTLWICSYMAKNNCYDKFYFDKYLCLSLIYKHGDFDAFMLIPEIDKENINRDIRIVDEYIAANNG